MTSEPTKWFDISDVEKTKIEIEDEVLAAVEEAKEEEAKEEEVKEEEVKEEEVKEEKVKVDPYLIRELRRFDHVTQKTCACCAKRVPLASIQHGKAEECDDCRE